MELLNERWAPILGYEGHYEVSDHGRVRPLPRWRRGKSGALVSVPGRIMRLTTKKATARTRPYAEVRLRNGAPRSVPCKSFLVHPCIVDKARYTAFQAAAQAKIASMRTAGEIVGRYKIKV